MSHLDHMSDSNTQNPQLESAEYLTSLYTTLSFESYVSANLAKEPLSKAYMTQAEELPMLEHGKGFTAEIATCMQSLLRVCNIYLAISYILLTNPFISPTPHQ